MEAIDYIKEDLQREILDKQKCLDESVKAKDYANALRRESELKGLMCAWQIVCRYS